MDGSPVVFAVDAVLGRWRLLLVAHEAAALIERFACGVRCRHGVARHLCIKEDCRGGGALTEGVPFLVVGSRAGVRACMGVLTPAVKPGIKVRISQKWVTDGSGEPIKYSALKGLIGTLDKNLAPGLWSVMWPSSAVSPSQFIEPVPIGGAKGQGLPVRVVLALKARIDLMCSAPSEEERLVRSIASNIYAWLGVEELRVSIVSRHDGTLHAAKQSIELQIHRSISSDERAPMLLARELVRMVNSRETRCGRWKRCICRKCVRYDFEQDPPHIKPCSCQECLCEAEECLCHKCLIERAHIPLPAAPAADVLESKQGALWGANVMMSLAHMRDALSTGGQVEALEYAGDFGARPHLSQIQRKALSAGQHVLHKQYLDCFTRCIHGLQPVVDLTVIGGLGHQSDTLIQLVDDAAVGRKVLADFFTAALPEYGHARYESALNEFIEAVAETSSVQKHGFELVDARKQQQKAQHNRSLRTIRREGMRKLGQAANFHAKTEMPTVLGKVSGREASMRLSVTLRVEVTKTASMLLPGHASLHSVSGGPDPDRGLLPVVLAMRLLEEVLDPESPVYTSKVPSVVKQIRREGSVFSASLHLLPPLPETPQGFLPPGQSEREKCRKCQAPLMVGTGKVLVASCRCLVKSHGMLAGMLRSAAPWLSVEQAWLALHDSGGRLYDAIQRSLRGHWSAAAQALQASLRRTAKRQLDAKGLPSWKRLVSAPSAPTAPIAQGDEPLVRESDVCAACRTGRMRGGKAGCDKCFGQCCFVGVRVRLRDSLPNTHHLAAFKGCDGWLQGRVEPGCWAVRWSLPAEPSGARGKVRGSSAPLPACVGKGGVYELCYPRPDPSLSKHMSTGGASKRRHLRESTRPLYFGEHKTLRQSAELGVLWPEPAGHPAEEPVLAHTARAGAQVVVSRAWCRATFDAASSQGIPGQERGRYAKFVGKVGVLTRPAVGGAWYVSFQGLSGEYAFSVSGGVRALSYVPAFYSSAVCLRRHPVSSSVADTQLAGMTEHPTRGEQEQVSLHLSFSLSKALGPGDTVKITLPGFSLGVERTAPEDHEMAAALERARVAAEAAEAAGREAEAATAALASEDPDGEPSATGVQAEAAQMAAHNARESAAAAAAAAAAVVNANRLRGAPAAGVHAMMKTPIVVEEPRLQHVRGNKFPLCVAARFQATSASQLVSPVHPHDLIAVSAAARARASAEEEEASWESWGKAGPGGREARGPTMGTSRSLFADAHWDPAARALTLRCSATVRPAQAVSLSLPLAARVAPPDLSASPDDLLQATISARTVTGHIGPVLVHRQPCLPSFLDCLVTVGGVVGLEELAEELRASSALLSSLRASPGPARQPGAVASGGNSGAPPMEAARPAASREGVVRLERRVKRLRNKLLRALGSVGQASAAGADGEEDLGVEVLVKWSHTHVLGPSHSVLVFVPGVTIQDASLEGGRGGEAMTASAVDSFAESSCSLGGLGGGVDREGGGCRGAGIGGGRPPPWWLESVSARPARAGVLFVIALKARVAAHVQVALTIRAGPGAKLCLDPDLSREAARSRVQYNTSGGVKGTGRVDDGGYGHGLAMPSARMGLLVSNAASDGQGEMEASTGSRGAVGKRWVHGDVEVPIFWTQTSQPTGGRLHSTSARACSQALEGARHQRQAGAARRWSRALGPPPPELVAQWIADAQRAAQGLKGGLASTFAAAADGDGGANHGLQDGEDAREPGAGAAERLGGGLGLTLQELQRRARQEKANVLAQGIYGWFRSALQAHARRKPQSPAVAFHRFLLSTWPLGGLGAAAVVPDDLGALMRSVAREMGVLPHLPGPRLHFASASGAARPGLTGSIGLPLTSPPAALRYPFSALHVGRRVVVSANHLMAAGWQKLELTRPCGWRNRFLARPPASIPTSDLNDYYFEKMYQWAAEAGRGNARAPRSEGVWDWLPKAWESKQAAEAEEAERCGNPPKRASYDAMVRVLMRPTYLENLEMRAPPGQDTRWTCLIRLPLGVRPGLGPWPGGAETAGLEIYIIVGLGALHQLKLAQARRSSAPVAAATSDQAPVGLKWVVFGFEAPEGGVEVRNAAFAAALQRKAEFSREELGGFGLGQLSRDSFVKVGDKFYKPADPRLPLSMRRVVSLTRYSSGGQVPGVAGGGTSAGGGAGDPAAAAAGHGGGGDLWEAVVDAGPERAGGTGGWEGWVGEAILIAQQRQGQLTRCAKPGDLPPREVSEFADEAPGADGEQQVSSSCLPPHAAALLCLGFRN